jgi:hypothetical protein
MAGISYDLPVNRTTVLPQRLFLSFITISNSTWDIALVFPDSEAHELVPSLIVFHNFFFCKWTELFNTN